MLLTHRNVLAALAALALVAGACAPFQRRATMPPALPAPAPSARALSAGEQVSQVLSRLTFGARPGDAERVAAMGVDRWIDRQLRPSVIDDGDLSAALASLPAWAKPTSNLGTMAPLLAFTRIAPPPPPPMSRDTTDLASAARNNVREIAMRVRLTLALTPNDQFFAGKLIHAQFGERQLQEVMADFWENHFSVYVAKMPSRDALIIFDRDVIRPRALGKFRDLLGAVAHSPAMLWYLDNQLSAVGAINENYARELMELHTLGVDGGYSQHDVIEVARALTGWSLNMPTLPRDAALPSKFVFYPVMHDTNEKMVLGQTLRSGRGMEDGEDVLDLLARHPSTAHFIAFKIARHLVSDVPPPELVDRAAATFLSTDGDIAEVVRTIVTSPEFFSRSAFRAKVKTPFEFLVSARRALNAAVDTTAASVKIVAQLGQPTFGHDTPEGWPDRGDAWMNSGSMLNRVMLTGDMVSPREPFKPLEEWAGWFSLANAPIERQVDGVVWLVLGGAVTAPTRELLMETHGNGPSRLRELVRVALATPEFQKR